MAARGPVFDARAGDGSQGSSFLSLPVFRLLPPLSPLCSGQWMGREGGTQSKQDKVSEEGWGPSTVGSRTWERGHVMLHGGLPGTGQCWAAPRLYPPHPARSCDPGTFPRTHGVPWGTIALRTTGLQHEERRLREATATADQGSEQPGGARGCLMSTLAGSEDSAPATPVTLCVAQAPACGSHPDVCPGGPLLPGGRWARPH